VSEAESTAASESLFSYGTLQTESVQLATFGRRLAGSFDSLIGYALAMVETSDQEFAARNGAIQRNVQFTGNESDAVAGTVFTVSREELERADDYEPADYRRVRVELKSGAMAWVYLRFQIPESSPRKKSTAD